MRPDALLTDSREFDTKNPESSTFLFPFFSLATTTAGLRDPASDPGIKAKSSRRPAVRNASRMKTSAGACRGVSRDYNAPARCRFARATSHSARRTMTNNECASRTLGDFVRIRARFRPARTSKKKRRRRKKRKKKENKKKSGRRGKGFVLTFPSLRVSVHCGKQCAFLPLQRTIYRACTERVIDIPIVRECVKSTGGPRARRNYSGWKRRLRIGRLLNAQMDAKLGTGRTGERASEQGQANRQGFAPPRIIPCN